MSGDDTTSVGESREPALRDELDEIIEQFYDETETPRGRSWYEVLDGDLYSIDSFMFVREPDLGDFEPSPLHGSVTEERYEELEAGEDPTPEEWAEWRAEWIDSRFCGETGWETVRLHRIRLSGGRELYFLTWHGSDGEVGSLNGPFATIDQVGEHIAKLGVTRYSSYFDQDDDE